MRLLVTVLLGSHVLFGHVRELSADETIPAEKRKLVVTVLDKPIYLDQITPSEAAAKRKELSDADYQRWLREYRAGRLVSSVSGRVLKEYAIREKLKPSDEEIDALIAAAERKQAENVEGDKEARQKLALQAFWVRGSSYEWRTAKALHEKYGGSVAISSFGACTSFEGRNAIFKDYADAGDIKFHDADLERAFWEKTKDERIQDVTLRPERVAEHFAVAPWERWIRESAQVETDRKDKPVPGANEFPHDPDITGRVTRKQAEQLAAANLADQSTSLADAVRDFNAENQKRERGQDQPPLTEGEVLKAVKRSDWKRDVPTVSEREFAAFKAVAETGRLPSGAKLEVLTGVQVDAFTVIQLWSIGINMPALERAAGTVGFTIRYTKLHEQKTDPKSVAWGKRDADGLSLGAFISPKKDKYALGERVDLRLFVRNEGTKTVEVTLANLSKPMPLVTDQFGAKVAVRVGHRDWLVLSMSGYTCDELGPGDAHAFHVPFEIGIGGDGTNKLIGRVIEARPGQTLQLKIREPNGNNRKRADDEPEPESGVVTFTVTDAE